MKVYIEVPATGMVKKLVESICDWCGKSYNGEFPEDDPHPFPHSGNVPRRDFECKLEMANSWPDGSGQAMILQVELGPCCQDKFFVMLKEQGIKVQEEEIDF